MLSNRALVVCITAVAIFVAGCSSGRGSGASPTTTTAPTTTSAAPPTTARTHLPGVLRGVSVGRFECPPPLESTATTVTSIGTVKTLLLCPIDAPGLASTAVTINASDPQFAALVSALSAPDEPRTTQACPMYADVPQFVVAQTDDGVYEVTIPTDSCGHYQRGALAALTHVRER
jgi:hypothetical protein